MLWVFYKEKIKWFDVTKQKLISEWEAEITALPGLFPSLAFPYTEETDKTRMNL